MDNLREIMVINLQPIEFKGVLQFSFIIVNLQEDFDRIGRTSPLPTRIDFPHVKHPLNQIRSQTASACLFC